MVELDLSGNLIGDLGARTIGKMLETNNTLTKLHLTRNKIGNRGAEAIGNAIMKRNLEGRSQQTPAVLPNKRRLSRSLPLSALKSYAQENHDFRSGCLPLFHLDLSYNELGQKGGEAMALALQNNPKMRRMDLTCNNIQNKGAVAIAGSLATNRHLRHLALSRNNLTNESTRVLGPALQGNFSLHHLSLSDNAVNDEGAFHLKPTVQGSHSLRSLDLSFNRICHKGDDELSKTSGSSTGDLVKMMARPHVDLSSNWSRSFGV